MSFYSELINSSVNPYNPSNKSALSFKGNCFQVFGFDILFDQNRKAWLLEINDHPSMDTVACKMAMGCNHKNCSISQVDMHVKKTVQFDTIQLCIKQNAKGAKSIPDTYRSLQRIMPFKDEAHDEMRDYFNSLLSLFMQISNGKHEVKTYDF